MMIKKIITIKGSIISMSQVGIILQNLKATPILYVKRYINKNHLSKSKQEIVS